MVSKPAIKRPDRLCDELDLREAIAVFLGADQQAQQIVAEIRASLRDQIFEVAGQRHRRVLRALHHDGIGRRIRADRVRGLGRPRREGLTVGERHARASRRSPSTAPAARDRRSRRSRRGRPPQSRQASAMRARFRPPALDRARRERMAHELSEPCVRRRILEEHELRAAVTRLLGHARRVAVAVGGAHAGFDLAEQTHAVAMTREAPEADRRLVHRLHAGGDDDSARRDDRARLSAKKFQPCQLGVAEASSFRRASFIAQSLRDAPSLTKARPARLLLRVSRSFAGILLRPSSSCSFSWPAASRRRRDAPSADGKSEGRRRLCRVEPHGGLGRRRAELRA